MSDRQIDQFKFHILNNCLPQVKPGDTRVVIPCYKSDLAGFKAALESPEVKSAIADAGVEVSAMAIRLAENRGSLFFHPLID